MEIEAFLLCDAATDQRGKLNILGAFDSVYARQLPAIHPQCAVVVRIRFDRSESGEHPVRLSIIDEDGNAIGPKLEGNVAVHVHEQIDFMAVNLILNIHRMKLEKFGRYRIDLSINDQHIGELPFNLRQVPENQMPPQ
jgi:hypothetical protein